MQGTGAPRACAALRFSITLAIVALVAACSSETPLPPRSTPPAVKTVDRASESLQNAALTNSVASATAPADDDWFDEVTDQSGLRFTYRNGREGERYFILETLGGGCALLDYDRDGDLDLFFTGGGTIGKSPQPIAGLPAALFRNDGEWRFTDVTRTAGVDGAGEYSHGCTVGDYDSDGWPDLFVCGYLGWRLLRNSGNGHFLDVTRQALPPDVQQGWNTAALFADFDSDGNADLYIVRYLQWTPEIDIECRNRQGLREPCGPGRFDGAADLLFRNEGDGRFEYAAASARLSPGGNGLGAVAADLNHDGRLDLYVANDKSPNFLYLGEGELAFEEAGMPAGVAANEYGVYDGSMGVDAADFDGDGDLDLLVANFEAEDNALYENLGSALFNQATVIRGLAGQSRRYVGFGAGFADFDLDGWLDLYVANGHVFYHGGQAPYDQPAQLFRNLAGQRFADVSQQGGTYFRTAHSGRGAATGDLDNDGALDLVVVHQNQPATLLRNRRAPENYIAVGLVGVAAHRDAVGARVSLVYEDRRLTRWIVAGSGYFSHSDRRIVFPAATDRVDIDVIWPRGLRERFANLATGPTNTLVEGRGEPQTTP